MANLDAVWISPADLKRKHYDFFMLNRFDEKLLKQLASKYLLIQCTKQDTPMILEESWDAFMAMYNYHLILQTGRLKGGDNESEVPDFLRRNQVNYLLFRDKWLSSPQLLKQEDELSYYQVFTSGELLNYCRKKIFICYYCTDDTAYKIYYPSFLDIMELRNQNLDAVRYNPKRCP